MDHLTEPLEITDNNLADVIQWLKKGHYVIIHSQYGRFFHDCSLQFCNEDQIEEFLNHHRIIYLDVSSHSSLLDDGEWNVYIEGAGFQECKCTLKKRLSRSDGIKYKDHVCLGY